MRYPVFFAANSCTSRSRRDAGQRASRGSNLRQDGNHQHG